jgi:hypothetical protein
VQIYIDVLGDCGVLQMKRCPKCNCMLGEGLREGQEIICQCGSKIKIHYTIKEQLCDPAGLLVRDPKYVSRRFQWYLICVVLIIVVFAIFFIACSSPC